MRRAKSVGKMDLRDDSDGMRNFLRGADCRGDEPRVASPISSPGGRRGDGGRLGTLRLFSKASAKEDLPDPWRPTTTPRPGEGSRLSVTGEPMLRKPSTSMDAR
jgi:hypothetical protein